MPIKDPQKRKEYNQAYHSKRYQENKDKIIAKSKISYQKNKSKKLARQKEYLSDPVVKERRDSYLRQYQEENRITRLRYSRGYHLKKKYGISLEEYEKLLEYQGYCCALCGKEFCKGEKRQPDVDHCHKTGKVRGILHLHCNTLLGHSKDNIEILEKAISYLKNN